MNPNYKVLVVHHNNDLDGIFSEALANIYFRQFNSIVKLDYEIAGYDYGKDAKVDTWLNIYDENGKQKYDHIQFIDVTPPLDYIESVKDLLENDELFIEIFDHHRFAWQDIMNDFAGTKNLKYFFDDEKCGAKIYYDAILSNKFCYRILREIVGIDKAIELKNNFIFLITKTFDTNNIDYVINLVNSFDLWIWKTQEPNNLFALALDEYFLQWDYIHTIQNGLVQDILLNNSSVSLTECLDIGHKLIKQKSDKAKKEKYYFKKLNGVDFVIVIEKANTYTIDEIIRNYGYYYKFVLFSKNIDFPNNKINISARSIDTDFDCNKFVKFITNGNGGGHKSASGGQANLDEFLELIRN